MNGFLAACSQAKRAQAIQQCIDDLYVQYENKNVIPDELL